MKYQALRPHFFSVGGWLEGSWGGWVGGWWWYGGWWWVGLMGVGVAVWWRWWGGCLVGVVGKMLGWGGGGVVESGWVGGVVGVGGWCGVLGMGECGMVRWVVVG